MKSSILHSIGLALLGLSLTGSLRGDVILFSDFNAHGSANGATSFTGINWTANGISTPASTVPLSAGAVVRTAGAVENANRFAVGRNIDTAGPWSIDIPFTATTDLTVAELTFDYQFISGGGANQGAAHPGSGVVTVSMLDATATTVLSTVTLDPLGTADVASNAGTGIVADFPDLALANGTGYVLRFEVGSTVTVGNNFALDNLSLNTPPTSPNVFTFTADPDFIYGSGDVTLAWDTSLAGKLVINDGSSDIVTLTTTADGQAALDAGTFTVNGLTSTTTFTLSATIAEDGSGIPASSTATTTVQSAPDITLVAVPSVTDGTQEVTLWFNATVFTSVEEFAIGFIDGFDGGTTLEDSAQDFDAELTSGTDYLFRRENGDFAGVLTPVVGWSGSTITLADDISGDLSWTGDYTVVSVTYTGADQVIINDGNSDIATITDPAQIASGSFNAGVVASTTTFTATASFPGAGSASDDATVDTTAPGTTYEETILAAGPVGFYRFEESTRSSVIYDSSGQNNHGTAIDNAQFLTSGQAGVIGNGAAFDEPGTVGAAIVTGVNLDPSAGDWSITALVQPSADIEVSGHIVSNRNGTGTGRSLLYLDTPSLSLTSFAGGTARPGATATTNLNTSLITGAWCHVALTYELSTGTMRFYLDGMLDAEQSGITPEAASGAWVIGAHKTNQADAFWDGLMDEVAFFDSALTSAQIEEQNAAFLSNSSGLLAFGRDATINSGESIDLVAKVGAGSTSASIDQGVGPVTIGASNHVTVSPTATTTYTLDVDGVTRQVTITVLPPAFLTVTGFGTENGSGQPFVTVSGTVEARTYQLFRATDLTDFTALGTPVAADATGTITLADPDPFDPANHPAYFYQVREIP